MNEEAQGRELERERERERVETRIVLDVLPNKNNNFLHLIFGTVTVVKLKLKKLFQRKKYK